MRYCQDCGTGHECEAETASRPNPDVEIARINADRDKYVARVQARVAREELETAEDIAETQAEAEMVSSVAAAEIIASESEGDPAEGEPIVVETPEPEPESEPAPDNEPPVVEVAEPKGPKKAPGWWDAYR